MPVYEFKALDSKGKRHSGIVDAESAPLARLKLRKLNKYPVSVMEVADAETSPKTGKPFWEGTFSHVKPAETTAMTRQLATLLGAGFQLVSALDMLIPQTKSPALKKILARVKDAIVEGQSFARAIEQFPGAFAPLYVNMVRAGESSGTLELILERLADIHEKQIALSDRIKTTLAYPLFVSFFGAVVLILLMMFVVPGITSIFTDMDQVLPIPTRMLIATSMFLKSYWWALIAGLACLLYALRAVRRTVRGQYLFDRAIFFLPAAGAIAKKMAVARFSRTLGLLLQNGVAMMASLNTVKNITGNAIIADAIQEASIEVEKGKGLGQSLASSRAFPSLSIQMIQVGEQSGNLEAMLVKVADIFEHEMESQLVRMISLLEPILIILMGGIVGFIVLSICLPIFEMNQLIQ